MNHTPAMPGSLHWLQRETQVISSDLNIHTGGAFNQINPASEPLLHAQNLLQDVTH